MVKIEVDQATWKRMFDQACERLELGRMRAERGEVTADELHRRFVYVLRSLQDDLEKSP